MKTKNRILIYKLIVMGLVLIFLNSCKKDEPTSIPLLSTIGVVDITTTTATGGGNISSDGRATITARGVCWSTTENPYTSDPKTVDGTGTGQFTSSIIGLTPGTTYHVRAYATNSAGTAYGDDISFSTLEQAPTCSTHPATNITTSGATLNGTVNANGLSTIVIFEYGTTTSYDSTVTATQSPLTENTSSIVSTDITGLTSGTIYHYRIRAVNSLGTIYSIDSTFITMLIDVDSNIYSAVIIGNQIWMKENLKTTKYNDGTGIPLVTDNAAWAELTTPGFCWYNNDSATYKATYGALYNWYAVHTVKLCPSGWHVSTDSDWKTLEMYLGMTIEQANEEGWRGTNQGTQLKSTTGWVAGEGTDTGTDVVGFSALPGGFRGFGGTFYYIGEDGIWWSYSEYFNTSDYHRFLFYYFSNVNRGLFSKQQGLSVRCLKDN